MFTTVAMGCLAVCLTAAWCTDGGSIGMGRAGDRSAVSVGELTCEYLSNPIGIDEPRPRLSWILTSDERNQRQTAYHVLIASSPETLAADQGDLWDSGRVQSDQSVHVEYAGRPLESRQRCHWKVRVWDGTGAPSAWSEPASWSMGLLEESDWRGQWIGYVRPYEHTEPALGFDGCSWIWFPDPEPAVRAPVGDRWFRRTFTVPAGARIASATALLSADDQFELSINGHPAGSSDGGGDAWRRPVTIDATELVHPGENTLALKASNTGDTPAGLIGGLWVILRDGRALTVVTDGQWRTTSAEAPGWTDTDFDDSSWEQAQLLGAMGDEPWGEVSPTATGWLQPAPSPILRKEFNIDQPVVRATAYICGLGFCELRINGEKVGDGVLDPPFTRYDKRCLYRTHDVTDLMRSGPNAIGVLLGTGWYDMHSRAAWDFDHAAWRDRPKLLMQLHLELADGSARIVATDGSWRAAIGPLVHDGIRQGEVYDARLEQPGWDQPGFDDIAWDGADPTDPPTGALSAAMLPPVRPTQIIRPVSMHQPAPGVWIYDFGQAFAGWARLNVEGPAGTRIQIRYGERLRADGSLEQGQIASLVYNKPFQTDAYILRGGGVETYEPRFTYHGLRYAELTGFPGDPGPGALTGVVVHTGFPSGGSFECSNDLLNEIQRLTLWAYKSNFHGYPTDCPHREKNGWTGDAHLAAEQAMFNWRNEAAYTKWLIDFADEQRTTGELPGIIPTGGWGYAWGNGPAWDSAYLLIPWYMYLYRGDVRILERHLEGWKRYVDYLTSKAENGIVSIGLGDWAPADTYTPEGVTSTGYYYVDARIVAAAARILGRTEDAARYEALADTIRDDFNRTFATGDGTYSIGSQTAQSCAVFQGLAPDDVTPSAIARLVEAIEARQWRIDTGILGAKYLFHALSENGRHDVAYRVATQTEQPSYGWWLSQDASTLWESWDGAYSRNHIMFGDISAWFYRELAGIQPDPEHPGFRHFFIRPRPVGDLRWVRAHTDCPYGRVESDWSLSPQGLTVRVVIPVNTTATVYVPAESPDAVTESGFATDQVEGVEYLQAEEGCAVYRVGSGMYTFTSRQPPRP